MVAVCVWQDAVITEFHLNHFKKIWALYSLARNQKRGALGLGVTGYGLGRHTWGGVLDH